MASTTEGLTDRQRLKIIRTPSSLGAWLAPRIWGYVTDPNTGIEAPANFRLDPWIAYSERKVLEKLKSPHKEFLAVNAPPQVGKSSYFGLFLVLWLLGLFPDKRIIRVGYSDAIVQRDAIVARDLMAMYGPMLFGQSVDGKRDSAGEWYIAGHQGRLLSAGVGGGITGQPADVMLIDDMIKNMDEAGSQKVKDLHWNEWLGTIRSRIQPGGLCVLSATRFAPDDLTGRIEKDQKAKNGEGDRWEFIKFPAIAEPARDDPKRKSPGWRDCIGRRRGEPLRTRKDPDAVVDDSERWKESEFYQDRRAISSHPTVWRCVYMQDPTNANGGMFPEAKWNQFPQGFELPQFMAVRRVWDLAATKDGGDWTTGAKVCKAGNGDIFVLELVRKQLDADKVMELVKSTAAIDGRGVKILIEQERAGAGKSLVALYKAAMIEYTVEPAKAEGTKQQRAQAYSNLQQAGKVWIPEYADWTTDFVEEHIQMTENSVGAHDDMIDTVAHGVNDMISAAQTEIRDPRLYSTSGGRGISERLEAIGASFFASMS